jgi:hypothetical protein
VVIRAFCAIVALIDMFYASHACRPFQRIQCEITPGKEGKKQSQIQGIFIEYYYHCVGFFTLLLLVFYHSVVEDE